MIFIPSKYKNLYSKNLHAVCGLKSCRNYELYMGYKIYRIIADAPDGRFYCYIGSTAQPLSYRLSDHESKYRMHLEGCKDYCSSFKVVCKEWHEICLVADLGDVSKAEAFIKEGEYTKAYGMNTDEYILVNSNVSGRTNKQRYLDKREEVKARTKAYRESHKEYYKQYNKEYHIKNKEAVRAKQREYQRAHPEYSKSAWRREKVQCECGSTHTREHTSSHKKTIKHQNFINTK